MLAAAALLSIADPGGEGGEGGIGGGGEHDGDKTPCHTYRVFPAWLQMTHHGTETGDHRAVGSNVLHQVTVRLGEHDVLVQLGPGIVEDLGRAFPAGENLGLLAGEGEGGRITMSSQHWNALKIVLAVTHVKGGSSSLLLRKTAGSGSVSQGGKTLPWSLEDRSKMVFSPVGSSLVCRGPLVLGALGDEDDDEAAMGPAGGRGGLRASANAMRSWHLRFRRDFSAAVDASLAAFM